MLTKSKSDQTKSRNNQRRRFSRLFSKMTRSGPVSPYERMECDAGEVNAKVRVSDAEDETKDKENNNTLVNKEVKDKKPKKKRSWKRFRQVALTTCRYIGMGAAHMSPATVYSAPDYYVDPKCWNKSFSSSYKPKVPAPRPHWSNNMMFTAGY